jgi:hypothetical protein
MSTVSDETRDRIRRAHSCRDGGHTFAREGNRAASLGATSRAIAWWRQARDEYAAAAIMYADAGAPGLESMARYHARQCDRTIAYNGGEA